jgi:para-nitrobenzyl esterase
MSSSSSGIPRRAFLASCGSAALTFAQEKNLVVAETESGKIRGVEQRGIRIFLGIPYGANTSGANRFLPPRKPAAWRGVRDCLEWGPCAPQTATLAARVLQNAAPGMDGVSLPAEGEDCLVLNVWTPAIKDGKKRPSFSGATEEASTLARRPSPSMPGPILRGAATWWW